ncbi:hypothetical protein EVAR_48601_1 [Eumeta japonica]|uniref:Uncharacterized protein n=1 Tax=Eumeta variegata TaxID=151549 RepID=A0A4C1Z0X0_EUMVA|nr:hypothetical protein EVAR_48601_1 [Eumeta japonica]
MLLSSRKDADTENPRKEKKVISKLCLRISLVSLRQVNTFTRCTKVHLRRISIRRVHTKTTQSRRANRAATMHSKVERLNGNRLYGDAHLEEFP